MEYVNDSVFGFAVPRSCEGVPAGVLDPASSWPSREVYKLRYRELAARFVENFKKYAGSCPPEVRESGPRLTVDVR